MKTYGIYFLILIFNLIAIATYSQEDKRIHDLLYKVDKDCKQIDLCVQNTFFRKSFSDRRVLITGEMDSLRSSFKETIIYYRSGLRKEKIKIFKFNSLEHPVLICYIVKLNGRIHYIKYLDVIEDSRKHLVKLSQEIYIDNRFYQKTFYPINGRKIKIESLFISNSDQ